jgi:hypothetical protein
VNLINQLTMNELMEIVDIFIFALFASFVVKKNFKRERKSRKFY